MKTIKAKQYKIYMGDQVLADSDFSSLQASSFVIVTDKNVDKLIGNKVFKIFQATQKPVIKIVVAANESSKSLMVAEEVLHNLATENVDREAVLVALGGGIVGDLTGFVASIYKRGVRIVQIPTTLLAQVDSSIGSKNGVNLKEGKNLVGTTYPPIMVISDTALLKSLPKREINQGLAEAIKYGVIWDKDIFTFLEAQLDAPSQNFYMELVTKCASAKVAISDKDPHELGLRKIINYGHTIGHALEAASDHKITHGEAVALGMKAEGYIANKLGYIGQSELQRQNQLIDRLAIKIRLPESDEELIELMRRDKKSKAGKLFFVMPTKIGAVRHQSDQYAFEADPETVRQALSYLRKLV